MEMRNLTPHVVRTNDGREFAPSGQFARVTSSHEEVAPGFFRVSFGQVENLPAPDVGVMLIVSGMVAAAVPDREDVVSPATGHSAAVRKDGQVFSVPGFVLAGGGK